MSQQKQPLGVRLNNLKSASVNPATATEATASSPHHRPHHASHHTHSSNSLKNNSGGKAFHSKSEIRLDPVDSPTINGRTLVAPHIQHLQLSPSALTSTLCPGFQPSLQQQASSSGHIHDDACLLKSNKYNYTLDPYVYKDQQQQQQQQQPSRRNSHHHESSDDDNDDDDDEECSSCNSGNGAQHTSIVHLDLEKMGLGFGNNSSSSSNSSSDDDNTQSFDTSAVGVVLCGADKSITHINDAFTRITGYTAADLLGRPSLSLLQGAATAAAAINTIRDAIASKNSCNVCLINYRKDGQPFWNLLSIIPLSNNSTGVVDAWIGIQRLQQQQPKLYVERLMKMFPWRNNGNDMPNAQQHRLQQRERHLLHKSRRRGQQQQQQQQMLQAVLIPTVTPADPATTATTTATKSIASPSSTDDSSESSHLSDDNSSTDSRNSNSSTSRTRNSNSSKKHRNQSSSSNSSSSNNNSNNLIKATTSRSSISNTSSSVSNTSHLHSDSDSNSNSDDDDSINNSSDNRAYAHSTPVSFISETTLPTQFGLFRVRAYKDMAMVTAAAAAAHLLGFESEIIVLIAGDVEHGSSSSSNGGSRGIPVRVHDACFTSEVLASLKCDCREQLQWSMQYIQDLAQDAEAAKAAAAAAPHHSKLPSYLPPPGGVIIYMPQEGRGIGLGNKLKAYSLQQQLGLDTVDANRALGFPDDNRCYNTVPAILESLNISSIRLMTNNPRKVEVLRRLKVKVDGCVPVVVVPNSEHAKKYMETKRARMDHMMPEKL